MACGTVIVHLQLVLDKGISFINMHVSEYEIITTLHADWRDTSQTNKDYLNQTKCIAMTKCCNKHVANRIHGLVTQRQITDSQTKTNLD